MPGSAIFSDLLGYTSIACWLGAQFPQVLENSRRQSCEGLALPFLANWFLGDFSNLVGCILTHQLPFQRYLATYFVFIDSVLVVQYFYYGSRTPPPPPTPTLGAAPPYPIRTASTVSSVRKGSVDRGATRYRTLSAVAANVAAAAALAAQQDGETARHSRYESDLVLRPDGSGSLTSHIPLDRDGRNGVDIDSDDDDNTRVLADSFHSEGGRDVGRKRVSWSIERHRTRATSMGRLSAIVPSLVSPSVVQVDGVGRGNSLGRSSEALAEEHQAAETFSATSTVANRRNSRAGRKSATMVFLSAWALFGIGTLVGSRRGLPMGGSVSIGKVLSPLNPSEGLNVRTPIVVTTALAEEPSSAPNFTLEIPLTSEDQDPPPPKPAPPPHKPRPTNPSAERVFGRIFAWLCTTLYLTSRLPQIWKNYVRKSVEGLSMYLFVFAFLGNVFYVASILFSPNMYLPPPASTAFLKESIPYLLGSGGTLMFDITIVTQSFIYKPKHKKRYTRSRSNTANLEVGVEEERTGLLAGDTLTHHQPHSHVYIHSHLPSHPHTSGTDASIPFGHDVVTRGRTTQVARSASG